MTSRARLNEDLIHHVFDQFQTIVGRSVQLFGSQAEIDLFLESLYAKLLMSLAQQLIPDSKLTPEQRMMLLTIYITTTIAGRNARELLSMKNLMPEMKALTDRMNAAARHVLK